jgi:N-acyl-L-homoserine lactone synthetase
MAQGMDEFNSVMDSITLRRTKEDLRKMGQLNNIGNQRVMTVYLDLNNEEQQIYQYMLKKSK